jgi:hypothetical protein
MMRILQARGSTLILCGILIFYHFVKCPKGNRLMESKVLSTETSYFSTFTTKKRLDAWKYGRRRSGSLNEVLFVFMCKFRKGVVAKRAKCVAVVKSEDGTESICGKVFSRVPNCKRHISVHQKGESKPKSPSMLTLDLQ